MLGGRLSCAGLPVGVYVLLIGGIWVMRGIDLDWSVPTCWVVVRTGVMVETVRACWVVVVVIVVDIVISDVDGAG